MKQICSINGNIQPIDHASISLTEIEKQYNFGVYETIKVRNNLLYFTKQHIERLFHSSKAIGLQHQFTSNDIQRYISDFVSELAEESCNLKILLYGGAFQEDAQLILLASTPFYPNRKWYKDGVKVVSFVYERWMPQAKTLNMLPSYVYYKKAKEQNGYDALLLDRNNNILEGTRTNVFLIKDKTIVSPPKEVILEGVTLMSLEKIIEGSDYRLEYRDIPYSTLEEYEGMFLSSTSSKILPVKQINEFRFKQISSNILELVKKYDLAIEQSKGDFSSL